MATMTASIPSQAPMSEKTESTIAITPQFIATQDTTLNMKGDFSLFTGTSFTIKTADGTQILMIEGTSWTVHKTKKFLDASGNHLFALKRSPTTVPQTHYLETPSGQQIATVTWTRNFHADADITFTDATTGTEQKLLLSGNLKGSSAEIKKSSTGEAVATKQGAAFQFGGRKSVVSVTRGMDVALAVAAFVCYDEVLGLAK